MTEALAEPKSAAVKRAEPYLSEFNRQRHADASATAWLTPLRRAAFTSFSEFGFPTLQDEDWRFTNVAPIAKLPFRPVTSAPAHRLARESLNQFPFTGLSGSRLVFIDGHFSRELSTLSPQPEGVVVSSLAAALAGGDSTLEKHLARHARTDGNAFTALNTAFFQDGAFIHVPTGMSAEGPVHLLFVSTATATGSTTHPRNLVIAERGSRLTLLESYARVADAATFTNAVSEFVIGDNAHVEHCKFQDESTDAYHIAAQHMRLGRGANFISHSIATGAKLSRNNINTHLDGESIECVLNGLYFTRGDQLADHHMVVEHAQPHCNSHEYFNGILDGRSKGVFHGRILVRPIAQKTDAKQTNKNLLLSDNATADTKPQLEIYADDVKCTHGATIGQLNEQSIFYLRARGIGREKARRMLIHAFAGEIIDRIRCEPLREEMDKLVWDRLEQSETVAVGQ